MSEILYEAGFFEIDLDELENQFTNNTNSSTKTNGSNSSETASNTSSRTTKQTASSKQEDEIRQELSKLTDDQALIEKLLTFGEPFKKACRILKYNIKNEAGGNPILAFVLQDYVKDNLINTGLLNANTFKAIYNAVAKKLVADSEFFEQLPSNHYNIIYCKDLYTKPVKEIEEYLVQQQKTLPTSVDKYTNEIIKNNKKTFLHIDSIKEPDLKKRAAVIKKFNNGLPGITNAKLNSLDLVKIILDGGPTATKTVKVDDTTQNSIVTKLMNRSNKIDPVIALAVILQLSMNTNSARAKNELSNAKFTGIDSKQVTSAVTKILNSKLLPEGSISMKDADALVDKIIAKLN
jgi:hypothetical protein